MSTDKELGELRELRGKVKQKWGDISDDEFDKAEGKIEELVGTIQQKYGESKEAIRKQLDELRDKI